MARTVADMAREQLEVQADIDRVEACIGAGADCDELQQMNVIVNELER